MKAGAWIGLAGSLVIAVSGVLAFRAAWTPAGSVTPAGWYADPNDQVQLRCWSGSR